MNTNIERDIITTKIARRSLRQLKIIAASTRETMTDVLARLLDAEMERIQQERERKDADKSV